MILGTRLITNQTGSEGLPVDKIYIEKASSIDRELYLSMIVNRDKGQISFIASECGGVDIEKVAEDDPDKILTVSLLPEMGLQPFQIRSLASFLSLDKDQQSEFSDILFNLYRLFIDIDASLIEVNPLIVTKENKILALDAKINIEDNALFRQPQLVLMRDSSQENDIEREAAEHDLNYVSLDGNIACMVNGAGLAMATMDLIKLHGGEPANFLDVGGGATVKRVTEALKIIISNQNVDAILVNIFGGIVRCDLIAEGIINAVKEVGVLHPIVVRLEGTNVERGKKLLMESSLDIITADNLNDAAKEVISASESI